MVIGQLGWEKIDLITVLIHLAAMLIRQCSQRASKTRNSKNNSLSLVTNKTQCGNMIVESKRKEQSPEKCPTFLRLSNLYQKPSSFKTIKTSKRF